MELQKRCEQFSKTIEQMKESGIPIGLSDLKDLAIELKTPIPHFNKNMELIFDDGAFDEATK